MMKKMILEHKGELAASSAAILLTGLLDRQLWWEGLLFLAIHWACLLATFADRRNRLQSRKALRLIFWIVPALALFTSLISVLVRQGGVRGKEAVWPLYCAGIGLLFVVLGNYMPKFRQNHTMGIRIKWTLEDEENWRATHRFGGRVWVGCGILCMLGGLLPSLRGTGVVLFAAVLLGAALPCVYSWRYHKRQLREGRTVPAGDPPSRQRTALTAVILALTGVVVVWALFFAGSMELSLGEDALSVSAAGWSSLTLPYSEIDSVEYLPEGEAPGAGMRTFGVGNLRAQVGAYANDAYGSYTRYTHNGCGSCVVLTAGGRVIVLNGPDDAATRALYESLAGRAG